MKKIWGFVVGAGMLTNLLSAQTLFDFEDRKLDWSVQDEKAKLSIAPEEESKIGDGALKMEIPAQSGRFCLYAPLKKPISADSAYLSFYVNAPKPTILLAILKAKQHWVATFKIAGNGWTLENIPFYDFVNSSGQNIVEAGELNSATRLQFTIVKSSPDAEIIFLDEIQAVGKRVNLAGFTEKRPDDAFCQNFSEGMGNAKPFKTPANAPGLAADAQMGKVLRSSLDKTEGVVYPLSADVSPKGGTLELLLRPSGWDKVEKRACQYLFFTNPVQSGTSLKTVFYIYKDELDNFRLSVLVSRYKAKTEVNIGAPLNWKDGQWHAVALSWNKEMIFLFEDGKKVSEAMLPADIFPDGLPLGKEFQLIGALGAKGQFSGDVGLVRISKEMKEIFLLLEK